ncbi:MULTISPECIES: LacI family DNA-binding transcriptional regulator [Rhizobium]|uniref:HTH-type transcriptional regulator LacI family n=1 Tax=Rhizobium favelukesii TaxID=348824 RepID=W6S945_9HYPH|nr:MULTISPECIES: LacI family DNA-binding transcriptional regulator [Rhizobium]MCS0460609.1 LacI family DNA-binding transcriptional regulator [Rhizobium favelukesii]UFS79142.1 LacI family DNA-binding transcriptional regulator [Rhizobium sp. T136]CDM62651.1 HTH-type transcriptional regulator LacI family [Rhizobium favelukesii]
MKTRPTIADLARTANVSVATVNRILAGSASVRPRTIEKVERAAEQIGFYGLGVIEDRLRHALPSYRFGFLLQQSSRDLYRLFGSKIIEAASRRVNDKVEPIVEFVDVLEPQNIANRLAALGERCDAVAIIAGDHPLIGQTIHSLRTSGKPVVTYITDQSAPDRAGYVGTDNWKLGRTAAWFLAQTIPDAGRIAVFIGNHRYQCQDICDASFRSYMREHAPDLQIDDSRPTHEESHQAYQMVRELLAHSDDLRGIYIVGGGISGVLKALRECDDVRRSRVRVICRDIGPETRKGLTEGLITAALCHPLDKISEELIATMVTALENRGDTILQRVVPFEIITPESV